MLLGAAFYTKLPAETAIHFDLQGTPNGYASKAFTVFGFPAVMAALQLITCLTSAQRYRAVALPKKIIIITRAIIPFVTYVCYIALIAYNLGADLSIVKISCFIIGTLVCVVGNYLPKAEGTMGIKSAKNPENKFKTARLNRIMGIGYVVLGMIIIISIFFPAAVSAAAVLCLVIFSVVLAISAHIMNFR